ncbi:glycosyltransferase [Flavobacterium sp.]|uniref:glycosyltransferase n=1 Tax=Flavobacterium sp. TaxID=239 RepID=UPI003F6A0F41
MESLEYTKKKLLSIIIPVYNCEPYLISGFEKLKPLYSSKVSFEIIYVNDGSTDNSLELLREIEKNNSFISVITQENQGSSGARNTAIDLAKGQYIQFLDSDDFLEVNKILVLLQKAIDNNLDAISYRLDYINENGIVLSERPIQNVTHDIIISGHQALIEGFNPSSICVFLFKTSFLNKNNLRITPKITHMDVDFTSRMMIVAKKIIFTDKIIYHYLQRQGSITKPKTIEKIKQLISDEIIVAINVKKTIEKYFSTELKVAIQKNYNSIIWNLIWRFYSKPKEVDYDFKIMCLRELKEKELYPIKGALKTNFQKVSCFFFNQEWLLKIILKLRS